MNRNIKILFAATSLILFVLVFTYSYKKNKIENDGGLAALQKVSGTLIYALSPEPERVTDIYKYNIRSGVQEKIIEKDDNNLIKFSPSVSPNGEYTAFAGAPIDFNSKLLFPHTQHLQIYIYNNTTKEILKVSSSTQSYRNKAPKWSPDGNSLMYFGYKASAWQNNLPVDDPDNWLIYLLDLKTKETKTVAEGIESLWAPSGKEFFYLKNDGVYFKNIETNINTKVLGMNKPKVDNISPKARITMTLAISDDGSKLAIANPSSKPKTLSIYEISYQPTINVKRIHRLETGEAEIYHPIFSPDGKFLAVQETEFPIERMRVRASSSDQLSLPQLNLTNPRLTIYELKEFKARKLKDLNGFDFFGTSLTQWIK